MKRRVRLTQIVYFILTCILIVVAISFLKIPINNENDTGRIWETQTAIVKAKLNLPSEKEKQKLYDAYNKVLEFLNQKDLVIDQITEIYNQVQGAKVCSTANRHFNSLAENYNAYKAELIEISNSIDEFECVYNAYVDKLNTVPKYAKALREEVELQLNKDLLPKYNEILAKKQKYGDDEKQLDDMYLNAKKIADDFFEEYYELLCHLVNAEAGDSTDLDQWCVIGVAEHRVEHEAYKYYTIYDVVYAQGQYAPTSDGSMEKIPTERVRNNVRTFLRGEVDIEMPATVTWQAGFSQGPLWKYIPESGHYYCFHCQHCKDNPDYHN